VIPGTLLGLVALAAALGPGYLYVRRAELHHNRAGQSQLGELVEMVVIGGAASLLAAGIVLGTCHSRGYLDTAQLHNDPSAYLLSEPWRCFAAAVVFYGLAYGIAYFASRLVHRQTPAAIVPGATGWMQAMRTEVPRDKRAVVVTAELHDGRHLAGVLRSFTSAERENRELLLAAPLKVRTKAGAAVELEDDFIVVREEQIFALSGRYVTGEEAS
jgi:Family of unknown function (DUF6338)